MTTPPVRPLETEDFSAFFQALYRYQPFPWQTRLALQVCEQSDWPDYLALPTASGKTAAIDIAIFALAYQASRRRSTSTDAAPSPIDAPRRIFFVVDRRIIVDEAYLRAESIAGKLLSARAAATTTPAGGDAILKQVADHLHWLAGGGDNPPLDCYQLRGGIPRDDAWIRSPLQPTIITSTVDQVGSRLLFRGYGLSPSTMPIHAALVAHDSLIILDEAHCSQPFSQTVHAVCKLQALAESPTRLPLRLVEMTATPPASTTAFELDEQDYLQPQSVLVRRHHKTKPVDLRTSTARGKNYANALAKDLVKAALELAQVESRHRIAIIVNRIEIARATHSRLQDKKQNTQLMIGRMRPHDRDTLTESLMRDFGTGSVTDLDAPHFVVSTQCIEVGADLDFDGMVSQCASFDALRQRFGRLDRMGNAEDSKGVIILATADLNSKKPDPIYGTAIDKTWDWLQTNQVGLDFSVQAIQAKTDDTDPAILAARNTPTADAPALMPAHLDQLAQTGPIPALCPNVSRYLHGPGGNVPEVRVLWRADIAPFEADQEGADTSEWAENAASNIAAVRPATGECLSVPAYLLQAWLCGESVASEGSDLERDQVDFDESQIKPARDKKQRHALLLVADERPRWIDASVSQSGLRRGATVVIPAQLGGCDVLGHLPDLDHTDNEQGYDYQTLDIADKTAEVATGRPQLRVHPKLPQEANATGLGLDALRKLYSEDSTEALPGAKAKKILDTLLCDTEGTEPSAALCQVRRIVGSLGGANPLIKPYGTGNQQGIVIRGNRCNAGSKVKPIPRSYGDSRDELSFASESTSLLADHLRDVAHEAKAITAALFTDPQESTAIVDGARRHDLGKIDPRFQAYLGGTSPNLAFLRTGSPLAKSKHALSQGARRQAAKQADLPQGFRHEALSVVLANQIKDDRDPDSIDSALIAHLVASHHGNARPWLLPWQPGDLDSLYLAPVLNDAGEDLPVGQLNLETAMATADRFHRLTRQFGWWGLAWRETLVRLADWRASAEPGMAMAADEDQSPAGSFSVTPRTNRLSQELRLTGPRTDNPLAFLATLGLLRALDKHVDASIQLFWQREGGTLTAILHGSATALGSEDALLDWLEAEVLTVTVDEHPFIRVLDGVPNRDKRIYREIGASLCAPDLELGRWLTCNGSDACTTEAQSQLQTARRDYFSGGIRALLQGTDRDHLRRTLFAHWDYADPIEKLSLHLEPREDRRHAYQWAQPSGDPSRRRSGGMIGANRLALEAWPFFTAVPDPRTHGPEPELRTTGFQGNRAHDTYWTWPIWGAPLGANGISAILNMPELPRLQRDPTQQKDVRRRAADRLRSRGILQAIRVQRILVGKTPNFAPGHSVFEA